MSDNKTQDSRGHELLEQVIALTGIPKKLIATELKTILDKNNIDPKNVTLEQLRDVVATYLRDIVKNALDRSDETPRDPKSTM